MKDYPIIEPFEKMNKFKQKFRNFSNVQFETTIGTEFQFGGKQFGGPSRNQTPMGRIERISSLKAETLQSRNLVGYSASNRIQDLYRHYQQFLLNETYAPNQNDIPLPPTYLPNNYLGRKHQEWIRRRSNSQLDGATQTLKNLDLEEDIDSNQSFDANISSINV